MGTVVDKKTLKGGAAKLYGYLATIVAALLALNTAAVAGDERCMLGAKQRVKFQNLQ